MLVPRPPRDPDPSHSLRTSRGLREGIGGSGLAIIHLAFLVLTFSVFDSRSRNEFRDARLFISSCSHSFCTPPQWRARMSPSLGNRRVSAKESEGGIKSIRRRERLLRCRANNVGARSGRDNRARDSNLAYIAGESRHPERSERSAV